MKVTFEDQSCHIFYATRQNIQQAKMRGKIFSFLQSKEEHTTFSTKINNIEVWHKQLGHCHLQYMHNMKKNDVVKGLPLFTDQLPNYQTCQFGKQNRKPFPRSTWRFAQKLS
jgi:microsomal dipeptidase-like Zn-dependent dipeptidase